MPYISKFTTVFFPLFIISTIFNISVQSSDASFLYGTIILTPLILSLVISIIWHLITQKKSDSKTPQNTGSTSIMGKRLLAYLLDGIFVSILFVVSVSLVSFAFGFAVGVLPEESTLIEEYQPATSIEEALERGQFEFDRNGNIISYTPNPVETKPSLRESLEGLSFVVSFAVGYLVCVVFYLFGYFFNKTPAMRLLTLKFAHQSSSTKLSRALVAAMLVNPLIAFPLLFIPYYIADFASIIISNGRKNLLDRMSDMSVSK